MVKATPLSSPLNIPAEVEVTTVRHSIGDLAVSAKVGGQMFEVRIQEVMAFRVMDEGELAEFWPTCGMPNGWVFEIHNGGWKEQELKRCGSPVIQGCREFLITGEDDCVSVLSFREPVITTSDGSTASS